MGSRPAKPAAVTTQPTSTTVQTTAHTTIHTTAADLGAPEVKCWIDNREMLYMFLAFLSGILLTLLVFAIICLFRKSYKRSHQHLQEEVSFQAAPEGSARNTQNEVTYSTLVFQRSRAPLAV